MTITDYKLEDFLELPQAEVDEYMSFLKFLEAIPTQQEVFHMSLKDVEYIKNELYGDIAKVVARVQKLSDKLVLSMTITRFFGLYNSIKEQVETISRGEKNGLGGEQDPRFEAVNGAEVMGKYGIYNTLVPLAEQFGWTIRQIEEMPYSEIFSILMYNKDRAALQAKMNNIKI